MYSCDTMSIMPTRLRSLLAITLVIIVFYWLITQKLHRSEQINSVQTETTHLTENQDQNPEVFTDSNITMDDPILVQVVRDLLTHPSALPYNFKDKKILSTNVNPSAGQTQLVEDLLKGFGPNGFFVECGANDGEWHSNTIWPELTLGWQGLLIEADPQAFGLLAKKNRKAWSGHFCLSTHPYPTKLALVHDRYVVLGGVALGSHMAEFSSGKRSIQCVPLYTVLLAINRTTIDYFSLDVEGSEIDILQTVPFDKVIFKVITIEYLMLKGGKPGLIKFMENVGYIFYQSVRTYRQRKYTLASDCIFIHQSVKLSPEQKLRIGKHVEF